MGTIIAVLVLITLVIVFSVQNAAPVAVSFLAWHTQASLAIIIFLSVIIGALIGIILSSFWMLKQRTARKKTQKTETQPGDKEWEKQK
jgi:uncharacterized integral membrane protein